MTKLVICDFPARQRGPASIFERETLPDFVNLLLERVKTGMHGAVMQVEQVARDQEAENPVMGLDIAQHRLDRMAYESKNAPNSVHLGTPP